MKTVLLFTRDALGQGDRSLGQRLLGAFLARGHALEGLDTIVFMNEGVRLVAEGSPVLAELTALHETGVDLQPCGTCLDFYGLTSIPCAASNMDAIVRILACADKVISL
jgi:hypothetical protein